jgi:S1-C subfamily serine protease
VSVLDVVLAVLLVGAAIGSYRLGFVTRSISWVAMAFGLYVSFRMLPTVLGWFDEAGSQQLLILTLLTLLAGAFIGQGIGLAIGSRVRLAIPEGTPRVVDHVAGAVAGALLVFVAAWLVLPIMADTPGWPAEQARASAFGRWIGESFPEPPDTVQVVQGLVGEDQFPQVFDEFRRTPDLGPPPEATGISPELGEQIVQSVVKIEGVACQRQIDGSGFVVGEDLVVTNAHVVAGEETTTVVRSDGSDVDGRVVAYDDNRDLAVIRAPGLDRPGLPIGESVSGAIGGVFGYPGGGPLRIAPFEIARQITAVGRDIYDEEDTSRQVLEVAAGLAPGDSGSALVDDQGRVVGVAFAIAPDRANVAFALTTGELRAVLDQVESDPVSTGACVA